MFWTRTDIFWLSLLKVALVATVLMIMSAGPAGAGAAKPKKDDHGADQAGDESVVPLDPHLVFMPALVVPVVEQGRLIHYFYVGIQLRVVKVGKVPKVKEQVPVIQDAFIRYVHHHPLHAYEGEAHIDKAALAAALMPKVQELIDAELVEEIVIESIVRSVI